MDRNQTKHLAAWWLLPLFAVANGFLRDTTYGLAMSQGAAHSLSVAPLLFAVCGWAEYVGCRWPLPNRAAGLTVGGLWLGLTLLFEFGFGSLQGLSMRSMLAEYDLIHGRLWSLIPFATAVAPEAVRRRRSGSVGRPTDVVS